MDTSFDSCFGAHIGNLKSFASLHMSRCLLVVDVGSRMDWNLVYYEYDMKVAAIAGNQH